MTDVSLFETLIDRHQTEIYSYILRMVRQENEAQDLCQETFLRAYGALDRLDGEANHRAWLYKIATNTTLNHIRHRRTGERAVTTLAGYQPLVQVEDHSDRLDHTQLLSRVEQAIQTLPARQRAAFTQRRFLGLSYAEIAAGLDCSEETARAHVYQAAQKLRRQFAEELSEVGI